MIERMGLRKIDLIFACLRVSAIGGGLAWSFFTPIPEYRIALLPLFSLFGLYSLLLYGLIVVKPNQKDVLYLGAMVLDLVFINQAVHLTGGFDSVFFLAFFLLAALHSFYFGLKIGFGIAVAINVLALLTNWNTLANIYIGDLIFRGGMLLIVAGAIGFMSYQIQMTKETLTKKLDEVTALTEVSKAINSTLKLDDVLSTVVEWTTRLMHVKACALHMLDDERQMLIPHASAGFANTNRSKVIPVEGSYAGEVVRSAGYKILSDMTDVNCQLYHRQMIEEEGLVSALCVPLEAKSKILGTLMILSDEPREFTPEDIELLQTLARQAGSAIENATIHEEMSDLYLSIIKAFVAAIDAKDSYTRGHSEYVVEYSRVIAEEMELSEAEVEAICTAGVLHDVGKIGISGNILRKPSRLTDEEFAEIKMHVIIGSEIVSQIPALKVAVPIIAHHHERWDGRGYPEGLKGDEIPLGARIIGVADAFEAMTANRIYRKAMAFEDAVAEVERCAGAHFDPEVVKAFLSAVKKGRLENPGPTLEQVIPHWAMSEKGMFGL